MKKKLKGVVLVPVDFSAASKEALAQAVQLSQCMGAPLVVAPESENLIFLASHQSRNILRSELLVLQVRRITPCGERKFHSQRRRPAGTVTVCIHQAVKGIQPEDVKATGSRGAPSFGNGPLP